MISRRVAGSVGSKPVRRGDIVRFAAWDEIDVNDWSSAPRNRVGLLIEYDTLNKVATVLCSGQLHRVRGQLVEKAGKKDFLDVVKST